jgi:hypothetical protein
MRNSNSAFASGRAFGDEASHATGASVLNDVPHVRRVVRKRNSRTAGAAVALQSQFNCVTPCWIANLTSAGMSAMPSLCMMRLR